jgi:hypothetical protein
MVACTDSVYLTRSGPCGARASCEVRFDGSPGRPSRSSAPAVARNAGELQH